MHEEENFFKGLMWAMALSLPIWGVIIGVVSVLVF